MDEVQVLVGGEASPAKLELVVGWLVGMAGRAERPAFLLRPVNPTAQEVYRKLLDALVALKTIWTLGATSRHVLVQKRSFSVARRTGTHGNFRRRCLSVCVCVDILAFSLKKTTDRTLSVSEKGGGIGG